MADTKVISSRDLVSQDSIQYIREQTLTLTLIDARPNTKMYVFFGGQDVTHLCFPQGREWSASTAYTLNSLVKYNRNYYRVTAAGTSGSTAPTHVSGASSNGSATLTYVSSVSIVTDTVGQAVIDFNVPRSTFNTGDYEIVVSDTNNLASLTIAGNVNGSAKTRFSASGTLELYQPRQMSITTVQRTVNIQQDPLAQSFFTYGLDSGIFITSIDVYFQSKDSSIPVSMELRPMINGYPAPLPPETGQLVSVVSAADVHVSNNASVATKFTFNPPVYIKQDGDYCFVLRSNSNNYNVFTSRLGETSIEDGKKIFDQPYIGSVFKSENNITWTAEQFEDLKFKIYKAKFDTDNPATISMNVSVPYVSSYGDQFTTTSGSNVVRYTHAIDHGLSVNDKIVIEGQTGATYNGISNANFTGTKTVTSVIDSRTIEYQAGSNATSTGKVESAGIVTYVFIDDGGINQLTSDTISFSGGGGSGAAATPVVINGIVRGVTITNPGSGYTGTPTVVINSDSSNKASFIASTTAAFSVLVNKPMTGFESSLKVNNFDSSNAVSSLVTTTKDYGTGKTYQFEPNVFYSNIGQECLIATTANKENSTTLNIELSTNNANVSPVIDLTQTASITALYSSINNQPEDTIGATNSSGSVESISVTDQGSNYTLEPVVTISAPDLEGGVQATATADLGVDGDADKIVSFTIVEGGSGYTSIPTVVITNADGDTTGDGAAGQVVLTAYNTELLPTGGKAKARYITKKIGLQLVSTGVRVLCELSSTEGSSVDWYIRTSLSGSDMVHEDQEWQLLNCATPRNRSSYNGDVYEYEFKLDNIANFNAYDLKCVLTADSPTNSPVVYSYRAVVLA